MSSVRVTKRIGAAGDSLIIPITKEAKEFDLKKGDDITVIIGTTDDAASHDYDFARMLSNPNASYENTRWLTPSDYYLDGTPIESQVEDDEEPEDYLVETYLRLNVWKEISRICKDFTRDMVSGDYAKYSDSMHSFIANFDSRYSFDSETNVNKEQYFIVDVLDEIVKGTRLFSSPVKSVSSLAQHLVTAVSDAKRYCNAVRDGNDPEAVLREMNEDWDKITKNDRYPELWYVAIIIEYRDDVVTFPRKGVPEFKIYTGPFVQYVMDAVNEETATRSFERNVSTSSIVLGPYSDPDDAQDMLSHFRIMARKEDWSVTDDFLLDCKNESKSIMGV